MSAPSAIGMPSEPDTKGPTENAVEEFAKLASDERIRAAMAALEHNGISCLPVDSGDEARTAVRSMLPIGAEVFNNTSRTLEVIGVAEDVERSGHYQPLRPRLYQMDREMQGREMRRLAAAPDYVVGSVHAVAEDGSLLIASASGSQLGPLASGAGHVILVIGGQNIVPDLTTALRRLHQYCLPLEDRRAREAYGVPSGVNNILVINRVITPGRTTALLVRESLGFLGLAVRLVVGGAEWAAGRARAEARQGNEEGGEGDARSDEERCAVPVNGRAERQRPGLLAERVARCPRPQGVWGCRGRHGDEHGEPQRPSDLVRGVQERRGNAHVGRRHS
jgi:LUD domain